MTHVALLSFDIDGTLEIGDPPGIIPVALVRRAKALGYLVGSCSDRPVSFQQAMWERLQLAADFTVLTVPKRFAALGDPHSDMDAARGSLEKLLALAAEDEAAGLGDAP